MFKSRRTWIAALLSAVFFVLMYLLISRVALSSIAGILITYESNRNDPIGVYYSIGYPAIFTQQRSTYSEQVPASKKKVIRLITNNRLARNLRIDPGNSPGEARLFRLELHSSFAPSVILDADDIYERFQPNSAISRYELVNDHVFIEIDGENPQLVIKDAVVLQNQLISIVLPAVFTLAFFLIASSFGRNSLPAFYDLSHQVSSANINYATLDGVRGIAVLLVLLEHTLAPFKGAGIAGVWIFFALSGFLLAIPFARRPELAISKDYMAEYILRRLKRIIPMYYFFIVTTFFITGKFGSGAWRHLLFLQGDGHLWTIPQEMLFYLFLPFIMLGNYLLFRGNPIRVVSGLLVLMVLANVYLGKSVLSIYGQNTAMPAFVGIFICGILFSYIYHGLIYPDRDRITRSAMARHGFSLLGIVLLSAYVLLATDTLFEPGELIVSEHRGWFAVAAGSLILLALISPNTLYDRFLSWTPLRAVGLVGFSFYLLHPTVISLTRAMQDYYLGFRLNPGTQLIIVLLVTYLASAFTYSYIERPFLKRVVKSTS